ncbi:MAG: N-acetylmuramoyl-L-alanine amidase [Acidobacteriota bacterium]
MDLTARPLAYVDRLEERPLSAVDLAVLHSTELPTLADARRYGERIVYEGSGTGVSGHYYVDRDGTVEGWVPPERVAHHAKSFNGRSVGIELVNRGRFPHWFDSGQQEPTEDFPAEQVESLLDLLATLRKALPALRYLARHSDIDVEWVPASDDRSRSVRRKIDPGWLFPWREVLSASELDPLPRNSL